jgi:hypothetical protein
VDSEADADEVEALDILDRSLENVPRGEPDISKQSRRQLAHRNLLVCRIVSRRDDEATTIGSMGEKELPFS